LTPTRGGGEGFAAYRLRIGVVPEPPIQFDLLLIVTYSCGEGEEFAATGRSESHAGADPVDLDRTGVVRGGRAGTDDRAIEGSSGSEG
jgi:hypothetical protein